MFKRVVFVFNPNSGSSFRIINDLKKLKNKFKEKYPQIECLECSLLSNELSTFLNHFEKENCLFVACGGDGTVSALAEKILGKPNFFLSVMPYGTGNDFSRAIGFFTIANDFDKVVRLFAGEGSKVIDFDMWCIGKKVFLNYFSIGFDAAVVNQFQKMRGKLPAFLNRPIANRVLYLVSGCFHFWYGIPQGVKLRIGHKNFELSGHKTLVLGNINSYAGGKSLSKRVVYTDKQLNIFKIKHLWGMFRLIMGSGYRDHEELAESLVLIVSRETMGQVDGEPFPVAIGEHSIKLIGNIKVIGG